MRAVNFTSQNTVTLLYCGAEFFPALVAAIDAAVAEVYLETYIFDDDGTGRTVKAALKRAAARGCAVNVISDWHGTGRVAVGLLSAELQAAGINHRAFNPWFHRGVARSHRKICVVDRACAFVGGLNVNDDLHDDSNPLVTLPAPRWDFAVQVRGPLADVIHDEARAQWVRLGKLPLMARLELFQELRSTRSTRSDQPVLAGLVVRDNLRNRRTIQRAYLRALGGARKRVLMANPYFAPGRKFRSALAAAAARGVEVTLLIGVGQFRLQDSVAHSFYPKLLKSGIKLVEYRKTQLHAKVAVVDDDWATVGSSNCDGLSLFINHEANVVVKDAAFARQLRRHIEQGIADGVSVRLSDYVNIRWYKRVWYGFTFLVYRSIMRIVTLGDYA
ncbi:phosphatidylserine/phosphatidylglycerophosphate/cardiolipin synthase family protein [Herminiimonas sp. CN]|uniref:phospholipase D-like domain-containing protein n=1 Tax=Herminiimonas sp. CN TaxID=1349818 RepID=UPI000473F67B|nr:phospholipase D-like domain-containing protein [Herminiimonas sp. CN]